MKGEVDLRPGAGEATVCVGCPGWGCVQCSVCVTTGCPQNHHPLGDHKYHMRRRHHSMLSTKGTDRSSSATFFLHCSRAVPKLLLPHGTNSGGPHPRCVTMGTWSHGGGWSCVGPEPCPLQVGGWWQRAGHSRPVSMGVRGEWGQREGSVVRGPAEGPRRVCRDKADCCPLS